MWLDGPFLCYSCQNRASVFKTCFNMLDGTCLAGPWIETWKHSSFERPCASALALESIIGSGERERTYNTVGIEQLACSPVLASGV